MKHLKILFVYFNNDNFKTKISDILKKYNFKITVADDVKHALQSYIKQHPVILIINPFFTEQNLQGVDIVLQLKKNNALLDTPVKFIGVAPTLNPTLEKILQDTCDFTVSEKNIHQLDAIIKSIIEKQELPDDIQIVETSKFSDELGSNPLKELFTDIEYEGGAEYLKNIEDYVNPQKNLNNDELKELRRTQLTRIIKGFWKFYSEIAKKYVTNENQSLIFKSFLRFRAILTQDWLNVSNIDLLVENIKKTHLFANIENIFYADEWLAAIFSGKIAPTYNDILVEEFRRVKGYHNRLKNITTNSEINYYESLALFLGITFFENQKKTARKKNNLDYAAPMTEEEIFEKGKELLFENEIMEMFKSLTNTCIGPLGNKIPILLAKENENLSNRVVNKRDLFKIIEDIEKIDTKVFVRIRLNEQKKLTEFRIMPYFILVPCSANNAICWDPWHNSNKRTSPGRVAIPIFSEGLLYDTVLNALGSLRWRTAKETADIYWMEEGLSGAYYQYWEEKRDKIDPETKEPYVSSKTNLEESFVSDYCKWIKFESKGQLKLKKEVREIFWFALPFTDEIKDSLRNRGQIYDELLQKDTRRAKSRFASM